MSLALKRPRACLNRDPNKRTKSVGVPSIDARKYANVSQPPPRSKARPTGTLSGRTTKSGHDRWTPLSPNGREAHQDEAYDEGLP